MTYYHGTTVERLQSILTKGLRRDSFVTRNYDAACRFAQNRAAFNGKKPVLLCLVDPELSQPISRLNQEIEWRLREVAFPVLVMPLDTPQRNVI